MGVLITPPHRLQQGITFNASLALVNDNFNNLLSGLSGFAVEISNLSGGGNLLAPTNTELNYSYIYVRNLIEDMVFAVPTVSLYVDFPSLALFDFFNPPNEYLFPTGAGITPDGLSMITSTYITKTTGHNAFPSAPPQTINGQVYQLGPVIVNYIRNGGASAHNYFVLLDYSSYSKSNSFYR